MKIVFQTILLLLLVIPLDAQTFDIAKMDQYFDEVTKHHRSMGSLAITKDGKVIYERAIGLADVKQSREANSETHYRIGSISKPFTAAIILQMIEEGQLTLSTKLGEYYAQFPNADRITIEHLLQHRSGLFNFTSAPDYRDWMDDDQVSKEILMAKLLSYDAEFEPGTRMSYCNTGYVLLSWIAEQIDGSPFSQIFDTRIAQPLALEHTYYGGKIGSKENEARSYTSGDGWEATSESNMIIPTGAGAIVSTPKDINTFWRALFDYKVINEASVNRMKTMNDGYGFGLVKMPFYDKTGFGHGGNIDGFNSSSGHFIADDLSVTYLSNGTDLNINDIMIAVLSIYFEREFEIPDLEKIMLDMKLLKRYSGTYGSPTFPLKIKFQPKDGTLEGQATGQPSFKLDAKGDHVFTLDAAGLKVTFMPDEKKLLFQQGAANFELIKE